MTESTVSRVKLELPRNRRIGVFMEEPIADASRETAATARPPELALPGVHLVVGETEVVTDLVQQGELDLVDELVAVAAVVEQRLSIEQDDIGQDIAVPAASFVQGHSGVEAVEGVDARIETELAESFVVGPFFDLDGDIAHEFGEFIGEAVEGVGDHLFEGRAADCETRTPGAGTVCATHEFSPEPPIRIWSTCAPGP